MHLPFTNWSVLADLDFHHRGEKLIQRVTINFAPSDLKYYVILGNQWDGLALETYNDIENALIAARRMANDRLLVRAKEIFDERELRKTNQKNLGGTVRGGQNV